jgi:hypothetical protein
MIEQRARRTVIRRAAGGRRPLTTAAFAPITGEPFPLVTAVSSHRARSPWRTSPRGPRPSRGSRDSFCRLAAVEQHQVRAGTLDQAVIAQADGARGVVRRHAEGERQVLHAAIPERLYVIKDGAVSVENRVETILAGRR